MQCSTWMLRVAALVIALWPHLRKPWRSLYRHRIDSPWRKVCPSLFICFLSLLGPSLKPPRRSVYRLSDSVPLAYSLFLKSLFLLFRSAVQVQKAVLCVCVCAGKRQCWLFKAGSCLAQVFTRWIVSGKKSMQSKWHWNLLDHSCSVQTPSYQP